MRASSRWAVGVVAAGLVAPGFAGAPWAHARASQGEPRPAGSRDTVARALAPDQVSADLQLLERALSTLHPGYERYTPRATLDAAMSDLRARLAEGATLEQMYLGVSQFLALIRCDHTKAEYPDAIAAHRRANPTHLPCTFIVRQGRVLVDAAWPDSPLRRGDEVLEIDAEPMVGLLGQVRALVPIDGYTEHARDDEIEGTSEYMGSALEQFLPILLDWAPQREILVRRDDSFLRLRVGCVAWDAYQSLAARARDQNFRDAVRVEHPAPGVAVLWVGTFVNYRDPVDPDSVYAPIFADLADRGVEHLIVDLRQNGGGSDDAAIALARRLIRVPVEPGPGPLVRTTRVPDDLRPHLTTWDTSVFDPPPEMFEPEGAMFRMRSFAAPTAPAPDAFQGRITLLTSRGNASGVTILLSSLQAQPHITTIGEPTGGSATGPTAGVLVFLKLPASGITVRIPLLRSRVNNPRAIEGLGIQPDILVEPTADDVLAGVDRALDAALGQPGEP